MSADKKVSINTNSGSEKGSFLSVISSYFQLTKPSIMLLVVFTAATSLFMEKSMITNPVGFLLILLGIFLTGGSANALNQYFERDIDALMARTKRRRPLPTGKLSAKQALIFSLIIGTSGLLLLGLVFNWLTALLGLLTLLFYALLYTLVLKPTTTQNIVIGGAAGAMAPVGAWAAASGEMALTPWAIFLLVFLWTPPHFWSLALFCKDDYQKAGLPMMPVVKGDISTLNQIVFYVILVVIVSLTLILFGASWIYGIVTVIASGIFLYKAINARRKASYDVIRNLFLFSISYLFIICSALIIDSLLLG